MLEDLLIFEVTKSKPPRSASNWALTVLSLINSDSSLRPESRRASSLEDFTKSTPLPMAPRLTISALVSSLPAESSFNAVSEHLQASTLVFDSRTVNSEEMDDW